jgi:hypothetical protein
MAGEIIRACVERELPDDTLLRMAERSIDERAGNAPAGHLEARSRRERVRMALETGRMWSPGRVLRVAFLGGTPAVEATVATFADEWTKYANIAFQVVDDPRTAELRIAFAPGSSWSMVGTEALALDTSEPTMNLGWLTEETPEDECRRVVLHEFGHALGCIHEHSSPAAKLPWDRPVVYAYYAQPPNAWTKAETDRNVIKTWRSDRTQFSAFDPDSIMIYPIPSQFIGGLPEIGWNRTLSAEDRKFIGTQYPFDDPAAALLEVDGPPVKGQIGQPGEVELFRFEVRQPGSYVLETSGYTDLAMKVFGPGRATVALTDVAEGGLGGNVRTELALMEGAYRVEIRHRRPTGTGGYALSLHPAPNG